MRFSEQRVFPVIFEIESTADLVCQVGPVHGLKFRVVHLLLSSRVTLSYDNGTGAWPCG
jgi:hypothetical protein